jgi:hypothetical protein
VAPEPEGADPKLDTKRLISERLELVGAKGECPVCERISWGVSPATFALIPIENGQIMIANAAAVRALTCNNCGFVRLHAIDILIR